MFRKLSPILNLMVSRVRALPVGTGSVARPLPIPVQQVTTAPRIFGRASSSLVRKIPVSGSAVPGIRGGLLRNNGRWILEYRRILQQKMSQGIPFYMAQKYAEDEARKVMQS